MLRPLYYWMNSCVHKKHADALLTVLFFLEALIFIIPTDPMLIMYCIEKRHQAFWYAFIATVGSVLGGITGYFIGYLLWGYAGQTIIHNPLINLIVTPEQFYAACELYKQHACFAILIAGFTPIPYKAATLTAGFCNIALTPFIICSIIARGARFFIYAVTISIWGEQIKEYIDRFFDLFVLLILIIMILIIWLCK